METFMAKPNMKQCQTLLALAFWALAGGGTLGQPSNDTLPALQARLAARLDDPRFAQAQWGVKVVSLDSGQTLFERNADKLMKPASNAKLYTAALALDRLGPDYRINTSFYAASKPDADGVIHGDLLVYGRGDPSFSARFNDGDYKKALQPAIDALLAAGIKRIDGDLVGDESYFHGPPFGADWTWDDLQNYYGAPASALTFQDNVIDLLFKPGDAAGASCQIVTMPETTFLNFTNWTQTAAPDARGRIRVYRPIGEDIAYAWGRLPLGSNSQSDAVSVAKPALWFVTMLKEALAQNGVPTSGAVRQMNWLDRETAPIQWPNLAEVASVESRTLVEIVKRTLKPSENLYAQLLLLQVGAKTDAQPEPFNRDTAQAGLAEMRRFLRQVGIADGAALLQEGSGLSRGCLVTPGATVRLLTYMNRHRYRQAFQDALPVAGVDGTLRNRFKGTVAEGNVHAKTGSLGMVDTLSGYLTTAGKDHLVFSIMLNNYREFDPSHDGRAEIDALVRQLAEFTGNSGAH
jgi:D-alanyl-D-alanine carboxypeptidase/D-alanyl-D-alanine-endopeptidase (penicillin-binding protein 4)